MNYIVPKTANKLEFANTQAGTDHFIKIQSSQTGAINSPTLVIEARDKGAATYEVLREVTVTSRYNFDVKSKSIAEFRFTILRPHLAEFDTLTVTHDASAGLADNSNLDTEVMDRLLTGEDYVGSNFANLAALNQARASAQAQSWALVADNGSGSPAIAVSNGSSFALIQQSGPTDEEILLEGLASGFLYVNQMEAG